MMLTGLRGPLVSNTIVPPANYSPAAAALYVNIKTAQATGVGWDKLPGISDNGAGQCASAAILRLLQESADAGMDPVSWLNMMHSQDAGYYEVCITALLANGFSGTAQYNPGEQCPFGQTLTNKICVPNTPPPGDGNTGNTGSGGGSGSGGSGGNTGNTGGDTSSTGIDKNTLLIGAAIAALGFLMMGRK